MPKKRSETDEAIDAGATRTREAGRNAVSLSELREQAAGLRRAQEMANLAHVVTKPDGSFETWSDTLPRLLGLKHSEVVTTTKRWLDLVHPEDRARFRSAALEARAKSIRMDVQYRAWRSDGAWVHVRQAMEPIPGKADEQGRLRWFNTLQDVTELVQAQQSVNRMNRVYAVLSRINSAIVRIRERQQLFEEVCQIAVEAGGFVMAWVGMVDRKASLVEPVASAGDVRDFFEAAPMAILETKPGGHGLAGQAVRSKRAVVSNDVKNDPKRMMRRELNERRINSLAIMPLVLNDEVLGVLALYSAEVGFFDADEMHLLEELAGDVSFALDHLDKTRKLDYISYYDGLTGLANRTFFHERLKLQLEEAARNGEPVALKLVDIARFKVINDTFGRQAGDALLSEVAKRIEKIRPQSGWCSRLGADHFAIVLPGVTIDEHLALTTERRLTETFATPFEVCGTELRIAARMGIAVFPTDGHDSDTLLRNAEAALKKAKSSAERYLFYTHAMTERLAEKLSLENRLRQALEREEFVLHYQPKVDLRTRRIVGLEALLRWQDREAALVPPAQFISLLEETGLILDVGSWALRRASLDHQAWIRAGLNPPKVAVNVSAIQLRQRDFVKHVEAAVSEGGSKAAIDLEITETLVMADIQASIAKLTEIRGLGVGIAIDDFGTGYSSLAYLARLPVEMLKIDRSFINGMAQDETARTLVQTIISLARSLRLKSVAEGVEQEAQATMLREFGCDQMQGYLFSKPLPAEALIPLLRQSS